MQMMRLGRCVIQRHEWMVVACVLLGALGGAARAHWHVAQSTLPGDVSLPIEPYAATAARAARLKHIHQPDGLHLLSNGNLLLIIYPPSRRPQVDQRRTTRQITHEGEHHAL